ncbi:M20/M25/M40 family metallo-hydrolase [Caulobacter segnis]
MRRLLLAATALVLATTAHARTASTTRMAADIAALSDDTMEGRFPGTAGETKALAWIEAAFTKAGLRPAGAKGWRQPVPLVARAPRTASLIARVGGRSLDLSADVILLGQDARETITDAPLAFAGHGVASADVAGAVVLFRDTDSSAETTPQPLDATTRTAALKAAGARAVLAILPDAAFDKRKARVFPTLQLPEDQAFAIRGFIRESAARMLVGGDLAALDAQAAKPDFQPKPLSVRVTATATTQVRRFVSANIVGRIPGAKPGAGAVLYTAHWDAFGHCRPAEPDPICNGAVDNASGVAGILELARLFRAGPPPERDIVFVATTAEEHGLLGSRAYVAAPAAPLVKTVASINIDTIALYGKGHPVGYVGAGLTTADPLLTKLAADQGRVLDPGGGARFVYKSSDAWPLLKAGVPAFVLSGVISRAGPDRGQAFVDFIAKRVHTPADELTAEVDLIGAAEDVDLSYRAGLAFSHADARVDFHPTSPFQRPAR